MLVLNAFRDDNNVSLIHHHGVLTFTLDPALSGVHDQGLTQRMQGSAVPLSRTAPDHGFAFTSFAYLGSLCGRNLAVNEKGVVNTVNNIRALHRPFGIIIPRHILARAALNAATLDEAIAILTNAPPQVRFMIRSDKWAIATYLA